MGMSDDIKFEMDCPKCGAKVDTFQSKDGPCALAILEYWQVDNFYASCPNCGAWIEFTLPKNPREKIPIGHYKMEVSEE